MINSLASLYKLLNKTKQFQLAKVLAGVTVLLLAGVIWSVASGNWGWLTVLIVPLVVTASTTWESLVEAYRRVQFIEAVKAEYYRNQLTEPVEDEEEEELTDESKLLLCQFYAFLYWLVIVRKPGESAARLALGMTARRYREWIVRLSQPDLQIVTVTDGRPPTVNETSFEQVLVLIARVQGMRNMWDFPKQVYADERNWKRVDPNVFHLNGHEVRHNSRRASQEDTTPLLPIYPHSLKNLNI